MGGAVGMKMQKGAFMRGIDNMVIKEIPIPEVQEGQVLVKLEYVGICGSDIHYFHHGCCGSYKVDLDSDYMLGHECAGTVVKTGKGVKTLKTGERVALEPGIPCGTCELCKAGYYNLCPDMRFLATPPVAGCYEEYIAYPENMCFRLPEQVTTKEGALIEPLSVGFHAANQGEVGPGDCVVILGAGCIGLSTMLCCKARGAGKIIVADLVDARLSHARRLGATHVINSREMDVAEAVRKITGGKGADQGVETAGAPVIISQTPFLVKRGGTIVMVGLAAQEEISYNFGEIISREARIKTVFRYRNIYPKAIEAVANGIIDIKAIVTHEFDLEHIREAFEETIHNKTDLVKAIIRMDKKDRGE